jgi:hypothetical protein
VRSVVTKAMPDYSGTALATKLGLKPGSVVVVINEPPTSRRDLEPIPAGVTFRDSLRGRVDVVVLFVVERRELERRFAALSRAIFPDGAAWIARPKKTSVVATDISEHTVREVALPAGLVDVKVCAIDATWSGLKIMWRKERRTP